MTRGKYAAKANGQRAEAAANTVNALRAQLDQERRDRTAETSMLKTRIGTLEGQLLREVRELAADEVTRVRAEGRQALEAEHADRRTNAVAIANFLTEEGLFAGLTQVQVGELTDLLGFDRNELLDTRNRQGRRVTKKKLRYADSLIRRGFSPEDIQNGAGTGSTGIVAPGSRKIFTVGGETA